MLKIGKMTNQAQAFNYSREVRQYFNVPKDKLVLQKEKLADFMVLLLQILDYEESSFRDCRYACLQKSLTFLHAFLGDTPFQNCENEDTKNLWVEFESLGNEAGSFIYSCVSSSSNEMRNQKFCVGIQGLLEKVETFMHQRIKVHCIKELSETASTSRPNHLPPLLIVDSLLEDLEGLTNGRFGLNIDEMRNQLNTLIQELTFLQTFFKGIKMSQVRNNKDLHEYMIHVIDAEYLINTYTVGHIPDWYLNLRLPIVVQEIQNSGGRKKILEGTGLFADFTPGVLSDQVVANIEVVNESFVVGFDKFRKEILEDLTWGSKQLQLISIYGMAGIGKTTIAKELYNDRLIHDKFDLYLWCNVSQTYNKNKVFRGIKSSLASMLGQETISDVDDETLIYRSLIGRKYLVILDDVWDTNMWDELKRFFPNDGNGSRILVTSRIRDSVPAQTVRLPPPLSDSECYDLLVKKAFGAEPCPAELSGIATRIASKCSGLPLAVVVVAGILANLENIESKWETLEGELESYISNNDSISHKLRLSYEHLPNHLKPCFLYLGAFVRGEEVPVGKLIQMWVVEGFVHEDKEKSPEYIANEYLCDLLNRSLLVIAKNRSDGGIKTCRIHDLLHDMCMKIAEKEKFLKHMNRYSPAVFHKHSHLALYSNVSNTCSISALRCRSLLGYISPLGHSVAQMQLLRVIDQRTLNNYCFLDEMRRICSVVQLRYLSFHDSVPGEIFKLVNLEYLHLSTNSVVYLPPAILKLKKLRDICITSRVVFEENCNISEITNSLKSLSTVSIREHWEQEILKCLTHLYKLKCYCEGFLPNFTTLHHLKSLNIKFFLNPNPLKNELRNVSFPSTLEKLTLTGTCLRWEDMRKVGRLPNLHVLKLFYDAFGGKEWRTNDGEFLELRFLKMHSITNLRKWTTDSQHFPKLHCLVLDHIWLQVPSDFGDIPSLHTIEVRNCGPEVHRSALNIQLEQQDNGNYDLRIINHGYKDEETEPVVALTIPQEDAIHNVSHMERLKMERSPGGSTSHTVQYDYGSFFPPRPVYYSMCAGCEGEIGSGGGLNSNGLSWHPKCLCCHACEQLIPQHQKIQGAGANLLKPPVSVLTLHCLLLHIMLHTQLLVRDNRTYHTSCGLQYCI